MACGARLDCGALLPCGHDEKIINRLLESEAYRLRPEAAYPDDYYFCKKVTGFEIFAIFISRKICNTVIQMLA